MDTSQTIAGQTEFDVFTARMQIRELARKVGFDVTNQARIALAMSSLARALRLGETRRGQVTIRRLGRIDRWGMWVACTTTNGINFKAGSRAFANVKWLVNELIVEELPPDDLRVTLFAWMPRTAGCEV